MVRNSKDTKDITKVSMSFIPSLRCNLRCSFCMYNSSPENNTVLNYVDTELFMRTVEWGNIIGWGLYGGEPSMDMPRYEQFYNLLPKQLKKFIITNGSWTTNGHLMENFLRWCTGKFHIIISGTPEHQRSQNLNVIKALADNQGITVKVDDEMHPMGRSFVKNWVCTGKCTWHKQVIRLGIFPTGHIILQNCDGAYPVVGHIKDNNFSDVFKAAVDIRTNGCTKGYDINTLMAKPKEYTIPNV